MENKIKVESKKVKEWDKEKGGGGIGGKRGVKIIFT